MKSKQKKNFSIGSETFPLVTATNAEKFTKAYGLQAGQAIQGEWFKKSPNSSRFYAAQNNFQKLKLFARGEQPISKYKKLLSFNGDLSYLNLDFSIVPIIPKFVDVIANGMTEMELTAKAEAQDKIANSRRSAFMKSMEKDMRNKDFLLQAQALLGVNGFENDYDQVPDTPEELEVYMSLNYKQSIEVAQEVSIEAIAERNKYTDIRRRFNYDLVVLGIGANKHEFDPRKGVKIKHVDPEELVYSFTESPTFDDCYYFGEVKREPVSQLQTRWRLTKDQLDEIRDNAAEWDNYHKIKNNENDDFSGQIANVLYFTYRTTVDTQVWKKKFKKNGSISYIDKEVDWNPPKDKLHDSERVSQTDEVWFEGAMILGTDILLDWRMEDFSLRPKSRHNKAISKYVVNAPRMYEGRIESITERMIPFGDAIQLDHLKLQQVSSRVLPDGVYLDADGLVEIDLGNGKKYTPAEAFNMFMQTGSVIGRSQNTIGEINHGSIPVKEIVSSSAHNKIASLIEQYNFHLGMLRDVTGINEVRDGSTPNSKMLVGVQEQAMSNSNTATKHIKDASITLVKDTYEGLSYRVADILRNPITREQFVNEIGKNNVKILDELKTLHLHDFGIHIEVSPDAVEREKIQSKIQLALTADKITIDQANIIEEVKNYKLAMRYLGVKIRKREDDAQAKKEQLIRVQSEENQKLKQAEVASIQAKAKAESDGKIKEARVKGDEERKTKTHEAKEQAKLMDKEFDFKMILEGRQAEVQDKKETGKEDRKDKRQDKMNTAQSRIAKQKETGGEPIDFESKHDSLSGFSNEGFNPSR